MGGMGLLAGSTRRGSACRLSMAEYAPPLELMKASPRAASAVAAGQPSREAQLEAQIEELLARLQKYEGLPHEDQATSEALNPVATPRAPAAAPSASIPSASEDTRTAPVVSNLVGDFHDRFWLPRAAAGDSAAASAASLAALSSDPAQRSVSAHLYAVRATQRLVRQVLATIRYRIPDDKRLQGSSVAAELESAVGAAVHSEFCRVFDDVSKVYSLLGDRMVAMSPTPQQGPGLRPRPPQPPLP